jgi:hypothetical protein
MGVASAAERVSATLFIDIDFNFNTIISFSYLQPCMGVASAAERVFATLFTDIDFNFNTIISFACTVRGKMNFFSSCFKFHFVSVHATVIFFLYFALFACFLVAAFFPYIYKVKHAY